MSEFTFIIFVGMLPKKNKQIKLDILHEFNSSFELSLYQKTVTDVFFLLEVHIFTFKAFPTSVATGFSALNSNWGKPT